MIFTKQITLLAPLVLLSGCSLFEALSQGIANIVRENADRPYFAYSLLNDEDTNIYLATITADRNGLGRDVVRTEIGRADLFPQDFSDSDAYLSVGFVELIDLEIDLGTLIIDVDAHEVVASITDTSMDGYMERVCSAEREVAAQAILDEAELFNDRDVMVTSLMYRESQDQGFIFPEFWVNNRHLVASYSLPYQISFVDRQDGTTDFLDFVPGKSTPITGLIDIRRNLLGEWRLEGCGSSQVAPVEPVETAQLRVMGTDGVLLLDGVELENALTEGFPLQSFKVLATTKWTFPF